MKRFREIREGLVTTKYSIVDFFTPLLISITLFGFLLRIFNIKKPSYFIFDETYYIPNARSLLKNGVELSSGEPQFIVHPPVGKWVIALGIKIFGDNPFGWRAGVLFLGTLSIALVGLLAKELFNSSPIALGAAFFSAIDGVFLVQSRVAILEGSLAFFILLASYCFLRYLNSKNRVWLLALSISSGLALGVKWSAVYYIGFFGVLILLKTNKSAGRGEIIESMETGGKNLKTKFRKLVEFCRARVVNLISLSSYFALTLVTYLITWSGWFLASDAWDRRKVKGGGFLNAVENLYYYHKDMLDFHLNLTLKHNYQANPAGWLFMWRPTAFDFKSAGQCGSSKCYYEILQLGNPVLWWVSVFALIALIVKISKSRFKNVEGELIVLSTFLLGYLPWFFFGKRTTFTFYSGIFAGFLYIIIAYVLYKGSMKLKPKIRLGFTLFFFSLLLLTLNFFYPIYAYLPLTPHHWNLHMWLNNWI